MTFDEYLIVHFIEYERYGTDYYIPYSIILDNDIEMNNVTSISVLHGSITLYNMPLDFIISVKERVSFLPGNIYNIKSGTYIGGYITSFQTNYDHLHLLKIQGYINDIGILS